MARMERPYHFDSYAPIGLIAGSGGQVGRTGSSFDKRNCASLYRSLCLYGKIGVALC